MPTALHPSQLSDEQLVKTIVEFLTKHNPDGALMLAIGEELDKRILNKKIKISDAVDLLSESFQDKSPGSYYYAWQSNIAMAFKDEFDRWCKNIVGRNAAPDHIHEIANEAAKNFLNLLIKREDSEQVQANQ